MVGCPDKFDVCAGFKFGGGGGDGISTWLAFHCVSFGMSCYYYSLRRWGEAPLTWYEIRGTGRCVSFPIMMPMPESYPPHQTGRGSNTVSDGEIKANHQKRHATAACWFLVVPIECVVRVVPRYT